MPTPNTSDALSQRLATSGLRVAFGGHFFTDTMAAALSQLAARRSGKATVS